MEVEQLQLQWLRGQAEKLELGMREPSTIMRDINVESELRAKLADSEREADNLLANLQRAQNAIMQERNRLEAQKSMELERLKASHSKQLSLSKKQLK